MSPCAPLTLQHPLSPELAGALMALAARLDGRRWFLIGAGARDLLLAECPHARQPLRRTRDLDLAVAVSGWDEYAGLRARLLRDDRFAGTGQPQRLLFQQHLPVDLVPWGHQDANGSIAWPPDFAVRMSVIGYDEAYAAALPVVAGALSFRCITLPGLSVLKLLSWAGSGGGRAKDATDFALLLGTQADVLGEAMYDRHADLFEAADFDWEEAGARALGRAAAGLFAAGTLTRVRAILERQARALALAMTGPDGPLMPAAAEPDERLDCARRLLQAYADGITEALPHIDPAHGRT